MTILGACKLFFSFGCAGSSLLQAEPLSVAAQGLLTAGASLVAECGFWSTRTSVVVACGLSTLGFWALECRLSSPGAQA